MECIFCKIADRTLSAEILYENDKVISILTSIRFITVMRWCFPKVHCKDFLSIPEGTCTTCCTPHRSSPGPW